MTLIYKPQSPQIADPGTGNVLQVWLTALTRLIDWVNGPFPFRPFASSQRPDAAKYPYCALYNTDTSSIEVSNGSSWIGSPNQGSWSTWSPTISAQTGSITTLGSVTARYMTIGKTVCFSVTIPITTNGTGASWINCSLPLTAKAATAFAGRERSSTGKGCTATVPDVSATMAIVFYDGTYPGSSGATITMSGVYESQ